jgi:hypothetical protein
MFVLQMIRFRIPAGTKTFLFFQKVRTGSGADEASYVMGKGITSRGNTVAGA